MSCVLVGNFPLGYVCMCKMNVCSEWFTSDGIPGSLAERHLENSAGDTLGCVCIVWSD